MPARSLLRRSPHPSIEALESRIAPAVIIGPDGHSATYIDVDGDHVTILVKSAAMLNAGMFTSHPAGLGDQLEGFDLRGNGSPFSGADVTVKVARAPDGDGQVNVGFINASSMNLGKVTVPGDLGRITVGQGSASGFGYSVLSLTVGSIGRFGTDTQAAGGNLTSVFNGDVQSITVRGDIVEALIDAGGHAIDQLTIGGSLIGGAADHSGEIRGTILKGLSITGDVLGGTGAQSGFLNCDYLRKLTIGGTLLGASGSQSGSFHGSLGDGGAKIGHGVLGGEGTASGSLDLSNTSDSVVSIGGDLRGGAGERSGLIASLGGGFKQIAIRGSLMGGTGVHSGSLEVAYCPSLRIGGSVVGGSANYTGQATAEFGWGTVSIGGDLVGGSLGATGPDLTASGYLESQRAFASITIGGSVISGVDRSDVGKLIKNASIRAEYEIGRLDIHGSVVGHRGAHGDSLVVLSAQYKETSQTDPVFGRIKIGGRVEDANILAGYNRELAPTSPVAHVGALTVGGNWVRSNLVAGAENIASGNTSFGNSGDRAIGGGLQITSRISSIKITGLVYGSPTSISSTDHFGFVAGQIGSFEVGLRKVKLSSIVDPPVLLARVTGDVAVHEI